MKFKLTQDKAMNSTVLIGSIIAGAMLSSGAVGLLPEENQTPLVKGGVALASAGVGAGITGNDYVSNIARGLAYGTAVKQGLDAISEQFGSSVAQLENPTTAQIFLNKAFGMGSGYEAPALAINPQAWDNLKTDFTPTPTGTAKDPVMSMMA